MSALWYLVPCSLVEERCFRDAYCLHHQDDELIILMMDVASTFETSVYCYYTILRNIPEGYIFTIAAART